MSRSKRTEAQMIAAVKQMEAGRKAEDVAREVGVSAHTIYALKFCVLAATSDWLLGCGKDLALLSVQPREPELAPRLPTGRQRKTSGA